MLLNSTFKHRVFGLFTYVYMCVKCVLIFFESSSLYIENLRDIENLAVASNLSFLKLWFFTLDLFPDLILVLWRTNFKSIPFPKEQRLLQYSCYSCLDLETSYRVSGCGDKCRVSGRTLRTLSFVNSDEGSFWWNMLLMVIASDDLSFWCPSFWWHVFRCSSSDSFLQTQFFRRILPDAFKLQMNSFALDLLNQNLYEYIFNHDPVHLNKCLAYPTDNF